MNKLKKIFSLIKGYHLKEGSCDGNRESRPSLISVIQMLEETKNKGTIDLLEK